MSKKYAILVEIPGLGPSTLLTDGSGVCEYEYSEAQTEAKRYFLSFCGKYPGMVCGLVPLNENGIHGVPEEVYCLDDSKSKG